MSYPLAENQILGFQFAATYINAYADEVTANSIWFLNGENALGPPDDSFALIYPDYGNGYLTLDMGLKQEIINGTGSDFTVFAKGGEYLIRVGNELTRPFTILGTGIGNESFDLDVIGFSIVRYVMVEQIENVSSVELDAIEAINYFQPDFENDPPQITGPEDLTVTSDQESVQVSWEVSDFNPWNYSILIDNITMEQESWDGNSINYNVDLTNKNGTIEVTLVVDDVFENRAEDTVKIEIEASSESSSDTISEKTSYNSFNLILSGMILVLILNKRKVEKRNY